MCNEELLNTLSRYDSRRKVKNNHKKLSEIKLEKMAQMQNISENEINYDEKLQKKKKIIRSIKSDC